MKLNIQILPLHYNNNADLIINDNEYTLDPQSIHSEVELRILLQNEPEYVYNAVIGMLKAMV